MNNSVNDLIRLNEVITLTTIQKSTIFKHMRSGKFPQPYKLLGKINAWSRVDIEDWIKNQLVNQK